MSDSMAIAASETPTSSVCSLITTTKTAMQDGIADARATVEEAWPKVTEAVNKGIYNLAYGLAFGVTFPVVLVAKSVPQNNCLVWGFIDGAKSAKAAVKRLDAK